jgi:hypothetical protein
MALIKYKKRVSTNTYSFLFDNQELGGLISAIHAAAITIGNELEKIIETNTNFYVVKEIDELESLLNSHNLISTKKNNFLIHKKIFNKYFKTPVRPDFLILKTQEKELMIIETKLGFVFDTKKAKIEFDNLKNFQNEVSKLISYKTSIYICCFGTENRETIKAGLKSKFPIESILTGKELCNLLNIDYQKHFIDKKNFEAEENLSFLIAELLRIPEVKNKIIKNLENKITPF